MPNQHVKIHNVFVDLLSELAADELLAVVELVLDLLSVVVVLLLVAAVIVTLEDFEADLDEQL